MGKSRRTRERKPAEIFGIWENQAAIDAHHASPMMGQIARLREKYDLHMRAERYRTDEDGVPQQDAQFIRN